MEEFRPLLADRLAITLINRRQITAADFIEREGGVVELTKTGRKAIISAWQSRKQESVRHPLLNQEYRIGQLMLVQARILARHLRGDLPDYLPCVLP
jgi:CRISPR-associated protein Cas1